MRRFFHSHKWVEQSIFEEIDGYKDYVGTVILCADCHLDYRNSKERAQYLKEQQKRTEAYAKQALEAREKAAALKEAAYRIWEERNRDIST